MHNQHKYRILREKEKTNRNSSSSIAFSTWNHCMHFQCLGNNLLSLNYSISIYFSLCFFFVCVTSTKSLWISTVFLSFIYIKYKLWIVSQLHWNRILLTRGQNRKMKRYKDWSGKFQIMEMTMQKCDMQKQQKYCCLCTGGGPNTNSLQSSFNGTRKYFKKFITCRYERYV